MEKLSAVILTFNEERNIARCIRSVAGIADEVLVVDSFSGDRTEVICREMGVRFEKHTFEGYIEQKNYAARLATNNLILSLDADEALSDQLRDQMLKVKNNRQYDVYSMNRLNNYCGKWIRHSGWYPDLKIRLFDRRKGSWGGTNPHDKFIPDANATIAHLKGDILHYSYYSIEEHRKQVEKFADISANALFHQGVRSSIGKIIYKPVARFLKSYFVRAGFLDGKEGWIIATMTAKASWLRYSKLYHLQQKQ
jgi:glycosyltransferase involved in cell wall biosynthesis